MARGSWPFAYRLGLDFRNNPQGRDAFGMAAFKRALIRSGYNDSGIDVKSNVWDENTSVALKLFQKEQGLVADGLLGAPTAALLLHPVAADVELRGGIPAGLLCRLKTHLSQNDPVAEAVHGLDCEGLMQINMRFNPMISQENAWDPQFSLQHVSKFLLMACGYTGDWDSALVAYVIGREPAREWAAQGKPDAGGTVLGGQDSFARATAFLAAVNDVAC